MIQIGQVLITGEDHALELLRTEGSKLSNKLGVFEFLEQTTK